MARGVADSAEGWLQLGRLGRWIWPRLLELPSRGDQGAAGWQCGRPAAPLWRRGERGGFAGGEPVDGAPSVAVIVEVWNPASKSGATTVSEHLRARSTWSSEVPGRRWSAATETDTDTEFECSLTPHNSKRRFVPLKSLRRLRRQGAEVFE